MREGGGKENGYGVKKTRRGLGSVRATKSRVREKEDERNENDEHQRQRGRKEVSDWLSSSFALIYTCLRIELNTAHF